LAVNPHGHSRQTNPQRISVLGVEDSAQSVSSPLTVDLPSGLNHHLAAEVFVLVVKRHV
jgi:hypothetical protein